MTGAEFLNTTGQCGIADAVQGRGARDDAHADRHAVAVSQLKVLAGLDGVSGAVSKVEELALVGFALVGDDHGALDVDIAGNDKRHASHVLEIEVHDEPSRAWSDGAQALTPDQFDDTMRRIRAIRDVVCQETME